MNISGIRPVSGFYDYNEINRARTRVEEATQVQGQLQGQPQVETKVPETKPEIKGRSPEVEAQQTFGAYDYAKQYNPDVTYSLKGKDSDIRSLDVEKAISNMQRDQVIHQYQYFVGESAAKKAQESGMVRGVEDFSL